MADRRIVRARPIPLRKRFSPMYRFELAGYKHGVRGTSRIWLTAMLALWGFRLVRRAGARRATLAATEILQPGQSVIIRAIAPPVRKRG